MSFLYGLVTLTLAYGEQAAAGAFCCLNGDPFVFVFESECFGNQLTLFCNIWQYSPPWWTGTRRHLFDMCFYFFEVSSLLICLCQLWIFRSIIVNCCMFVLYLPTVLRRCVHSYTVWIYIIYIHIYIYAHMHINI